MKTIYDYDPTPEELSELGFEDETDYLDFRTDEDKAEDVKRLLALRAHVSEDLPL